MAKTYEMVDLNNLSYSDIQRMKQRIAEVESTITRTYEVSFKITFAAARDDDLADLESFADHVHDAFDYFGLVGPRECITDINVVEI